MNFGPFFVIFKMQQHSIGQRPFRQFFLCFKNWFLFSLFVQNFRMASSMEVYPLRLTRGQELKSSLLQFVIDHNLSAPFVLTCCGSVSSATLRFAKPQNGESEKVQKFDEYFEICSLVGTLSGSGHLHTVLGKEDGSTISGHVVSDMIIHTTAEVVIGNCDNFKFQRKFDPQTGFGELDILSNCSA